jgi:exosome complex component RRP41
MFCFVFVITNYVFVPGGPTLTVAALPLSGKIAFMEMSQRFHLDQLPKVLETALQGCKEIQTILDSSVREHLAQVGSASDWGNFGK